MGGGLTQAPIYEVNEFMLGGGVVFNVSIRGSGTPCSFSKQEFPQGRYSCVHVMFHFLFHLVLDYNV